MALDFEVNFAKAISGVQAFHANLLDAGRALDKIEAKAGKAFARTKMADGVRQARLEIEGYAKHFGVAGQRASDAMGTAEKQMLKALGGIANGYFNAALKAKGWADKNDELHNTLSNTARLQSYAKWQSKIATLHTEAAGQADYYRSLLKFLNTEEGKASSVLKVKARAAEKANSADAERTAKAREIKRELKALDDVVGRGIVRDQETLKGKRALIAFDAKQTQANKLLVKQLEYLDTAKGKTAARREAELKGKRQLAAFTQNEANKSALLVKQLEYLDTAKGKAAARRESELKGKRALAAFTQDEANKSALLVKQLAYLDTAKGKAQARRESELKGKRQLASFTQDEANKNALLVKQLEYLDTAKGKAQARRQVELKGRRELAGFLQEQVNKTALLRKEVEYLGTAEGREQAQLAEQRKGRRQLASFLTQQANKTQLLRKEVEFLGTAEGREQAQLAQQRKHRQDLATYLQKQANKTELLRKEIAFLASAEGQEQARLTQQKKHRQELAGYLEKQANKTELLRREAQFLASVEGQEQVRLAAQNQARRAQIDYLDRQAARTAELRAQKDFLASAEGEEQARLAASNRARTAAITFLERQAIKTAELRAEIEFLATAEGRELMQLERRRRAIRRDAGGTGGQAATDADRLAEATRRLTEAEARAQAQRERTIRGAQAYNEAMVRNAQAARDAQDATSIYARQLRLANEGMLTAPAERLNQQLALLAANGRQATSSLHALTKPQAALAASEERASRLLELRNRLTMAQARANEVRSGSEARLTREMEHQIAAAERRNRLMAMTTTELLGLSKANSRVSRSFNATNQAASMLRAGLNGLHTSIGMYAGSTILLASATYALSSALRSTVAAGAEFNETMSRAEAIMMTGNGALTAAGDSMAAVEEMVRALGASTLFTATEVSAGLVDLGMAGLSAGDAMTALAPALNLAAIGAVSMSESADIATNVMTSFRMEASDLGEVVDVMATAVTNSNTNVQQLANALTYVGPAAAAAGFSLRDTVATIELLSNSGIKASKAGTGLRRFMLNIQNPGKKTNEVLARYNISILDAAGSTRTMTDILGQFHEALYNDAITPAERTAAVMDLVGVRAHSAVSRMIGAFGEFGTLRRQLEEVEGAAEAMRETLEDNLKHDWKALKSAFQDVQLEIFEDYQSFLRRWTGEITLALATMQDKVGDIKIGVNADGSDKLLPYDSIDVFVARLDQAKDAALGLGAAFLTFKAAGVATTLLTATSVATQGLADRMGILNARTGLAAMSMANFSLTLKSAWGTITAHAANIWYAGSAYSALTAIAYTTTAAVTGLFRALAFVAPIVGWVGVIVGAGYAIKSLFSDDIQQRIVKHNESIKESEARYKALEEQLDRTHDKRMRNALALRRAEARTELNATTEAIERIVVAVEYETDEAARQRLVDHLTDLRLRAGDLGNQITESSKAIDELSVNRVGFERLKEQMHELAMQLGENRKRAAELEKRQESLTRQGREFRREAARVGDELDLVNTRIDTLASAYRRLVTEIDEAKGELVSFTELTQQGIAKLEMQLNMKHEFEGLSDEEKLNSLLTDREVIYAKIAKLDRETKKGRDTWQRLFGEAYELTKDINELEHSRRDTLADIVVQYREINAARNNEKATLADINAKITEIEATRHRMSDLSAEEEVPFNATKYHELGEELKALYDERNAMMEEAADAAQRAADKTSKATKKALEEQIKAVQALLDEMYPLRAQQRQYREEVALLSAEYARLITVAAQAAASQGVMSQAYLDAQTRMMTVRQAMDDHPGWRADQAFEEQREALEGLMDTLYPDQAKQREYLENITLLTEGHGKLVEAAERAADRHGAFSEEAIEARDAVFDLDDALGKLKDSLESKTDVMDEFAKNAAQGMQQHFADFLFDPFEEGLKGMLANFQTLIQRLIAEAVAADLTRRLFGSAGGGNGDGWVGTALDWGIKAMGLSMGGGTGAVGYASTGAGTGGWAHAATGSFDGGGFTGWGARAGGLDGKGGFMAMLHPNETVVDHTKGGGTGTTQNVTNTFILEERRDRRTQSQIAMQAAKGQRRANARLGS